MNYEETQKYLTEVRGILENSKNYDISSVTTSLLRSIATSMFVIASIVADMEFADEEERNKRNNCLVGKED